MNLQDYERFYFAVYQAFADTVAHLLERSIAAAGDLPKPQSIQARAKTPESLHKRMQETGNLDADVAMVRRDLAGVRIIFYTNNDVDRFLNSSIVFDNFDVDRDATKIHHPVEENGQVRYQAVHYTVSLNEARAVLPEYRDFAGLRCEIQIQTILIHAWAETSHDIIYKIDDREGFGNEALDQIRKRFDRIMDRYLMPAGYEFQRVQQDYERLVAGKQLFDQNLLESLKAAADNNERFDLVSSLSDDLLPLYDDVPSVFPEVVEVLVGAVEAARATTTKPIETPFSTFDGHAAEEIAEKVVEVIDRYRYTAVEEVYLALQRIFVGEAEERIRTKILDAVGHLAQYNLQVWEQVGPDVQRRLAKLIKRKKDCSTETRPLIVETWKELLDAEATGTEWSADAVSWQAGEVSVATVYELRQTAMTALFELFETAVDDRERRLVFHALDNATRTASRSGPSGDFLRQVLIDHAAIISFYTSRAEQISYELRETIEHNALYAYYRTTELLGTKGAAMGCLHQASQLAEAILALRDRFNTDQTFVRYKILVGFEGVMPQQWEDRGFDHAKVDAYRDSQIEAFLDEVDDRSRSTWLEFLERCAATRSDDMATFPKLGQFIVKLSENQPSVAKFLLANGNDDLLRFLPGFLNGLIKSGDHAAYKQSLDEFLARPGHLLSIAVHWRGSSPNNPETLKVLLNRAIEDDDRHAIAECLLFAMRNYPENVPSNDELVRPALRHLIAVKDARWINLAWLPERTPFFETFEAIDASLILESLVEFPEIPWNGERILSFVAEPYLELVWDFLGRRLQHPSEGGDDVRYEAVPHRFQLLAASLSSDARLAVAKARGWFEEDSSLFGYRGGRVLASIFSGCPPEFAAALVALIDAGTVKDAKFILSVMQNYHGETSTHSVLKALLLKLPDDEGVRAGVSRSLENTGVVHGEFGFVESLRMKKALIEPWLEDGDVRISGFARRQIADIDRRIQSEKRRADAQSALRKLEFDNLDDADGNREGG